MFFSLKSLCFHRFRNFIKLIYTRVAKSMKLERKSRHRQCAEKKSSAGLKLYRDVCGHKFISNYFCNISEVEQKQNDKKCLSSITADRKTQQIWKQIQRMR